MNIEVSGLLSLFSALSGVEKWSDAWLQDGLLPEQFTHALNEQIALLQQGQAQLPTAGMQDGLPLLQTLATVSGKGLPTAGKKGDIDLDATMQALADILKTIETTEPIAEGLSEQSLSDEVGAQTPFLSPDSALTVLQQPGKAEELIGTMSTEFSALAVVSDKGSKTMLNIMDKTVAEPVVTSTQPSSLESMLEQGQDTSAFNQDNSADSAEEQFATEFTSRKLIDVVKDQGSAKIVADIAMLNRAVGTEAKTEIAPMTRHFVHPEWSHELSERLVWMHKQAIPSAELNLNPRHLGPISIRVDVNQEQTSIAFATQHAVVKEAIEAAIPRLREMLGAQQLNLIDVNVSQQQSGQKQANDFFHMAGERRGNNDGGERGQTADSVSVAEEIEAGRAVASRGLLNIFA